jgi:hypothetical protein
MRGQAIDRLDSSGLLVLYVRWHEIEKVSVECQCIPAFHELREMIHSIYSI